MSNKKNIAFYGIVLALFIAASFLLFNRQKPPAIKYSDIISDFKEKKVSEFVINDNKLKMTLKSGETLTYRLPSVDLFLYDLGETINEQYQAGEIKSYDYTVSEVSWFASMIPYLLLFGAIIIFWVIIMRRTGGGGQASQFGRAKTKLVGAKTKKTFADVAGVDEEKIELAEIVDFLKNPKKYVDMGARIPKGVLLVGPPGTGKTLLAKAVAGEANVPFFSISGSDFVEMFVGVGASRVRDMFETAKKNLPSILFIDEIDAVGRHRGAGFGGGHDEREQTLNQLLVEMDGFGDNEGIIIIAATNRPDILDPALLRPGRFDRRITVGYPDIKGREEILKVHAKGKPFAEDVNLATIAKTSVGMTGADLENVLNEAALIAARKDEKEIHEKDIEEATIKVVMGPEKKSQIISDKEKKLTAYHEAGHAILTKFMDKSDPVHQVSIIPRGGAGGYTMHLPSEDKRYISRDEMFQEICVLLGGRVAEELILGDISTGASSDISRASNIARKMVTKYGMSAKLGAIEYGSEHDEVFLGRDFSTSRTFSEKYSAEIDDEVKDIIDQQYKIATKLLKDNTEILHRVANALLEHEKLSSDEFEAMFASSVEKEQEKKQEEEN